MIRSPAVAGQFYPGRKKSLLATLKQFVPSVADKQKVIGVVSPHAGYVYSGPVAGRLFASVEIPQTVVILGVNHRGLGDPYAIDEREGWETPLGIVPVCRDLVSKIRGHCPDLQPIDPFFDEEHSLEVQVPFIQYFSPDASIVPIMIGGGDPEVFRRLGQGIAQAVREWGKETLLVASSDMTHYEDAASAQKKDDFAIEAIAQLDPDLLLKRLKQYRISMCGFAPTAIMLHAAKALGATRGELVDYRNSGDETGDYASVVGYAGMMVM